MILFAAIISHVWKRQMCCNEQFVDDKLAEPQQMPLNAALSQTQQEYYHENLCGSTRKFARVCELSCLFGF